MFTWPAAREKALPPAQLAAAASTRASPSGVTEASVLWLTITTSPMAASARATTWKLRRRSLASHMARPMVKNTWVCTTSEAKPGEMKPLMAM